MVSLVLEPGGGAGIRKARLKVFDAISDGESAAVTVVGAITSNAIAAVADGLLLYANLFATKKAAFHFYGLSSLTSKIPKGFQIHHVRINRRGEDSSLILGDETYLATAVVHRVGANPPVCPLRFASDPLKAHRTLTAAIAAGTAVEAGDVFTAATLTAAKKPRTNTNTKNQ
jgi:hypothetical protein